MTRFDVLDPTRPDDPRFDPHGAQAQRVRTEARAEATASRPAGRRVLARVALAACVVAILAVAASVLLTTRSPPGARAALQRAAARTASFDSGRIIFTQGSEPRASLDSSFAAGPVVSRVLTRGRSKVVQTRSHAVAPATPLDAEAVVRMRPEPHSLTSKLNIIPLSWCSAMWQCAIQVPGLLTSRRMSTVSPVRTRTVSFQTRLSSTAPSRLRTRKRPAP
jgi:hypothetical protein